MSLPTWRRMSDGRAARRSTCAPPIGRAIRSANACASGSKRSSAGSRRSATSVARAIGASSGPASPPTWSALPTTSGGSLSSVRPDESSRHKLYLPGHPGNYPIHNPNTHFVTSSDHAKLVIQPFHQHPAREIVIDLGNRVSKPRTTARLRILGVCPNGEAHSLGLLILLELLRQDGAAATFTGENKSPDEVRAFVRRFAPDLVCVSCTVAECLPSAVELIRSLKADSPGLTVIAGGKAAVSAPSELLAAGCSQIFRSRGEARRAVRRYASQRKPRPARPAEPRPIPNGSATPPFVEARPLTGSGSRS